MLVPFVSIMDRLKLIVVASSVCVDDFQRPILRLLGLGGQEALLSKSAVAPGVRTRGKE